MAGVQAEGNQQIRPLCHFLVQQDDQIVWRKLMFRSGNSVDVTNTGARDGDELVQVYV